MQLCILLMLAALLTWGCYPDPTVKPPWIEDLWSKLECGMTVDEISKLTERAVVDLEGGHSFWGSHLIGTAWHDLWLGLASGRLETLAWGAAESSKSTRLSPRWNLCTNEWSFLVNVVWGYDLQGANVYVDGELIARGVAMPPPLELSVGRHELRVEKPDREPIVWHFQLDHGVRGDYRIDLTQLAEKPTSE